jgi:hypothetical protein
VQIPVAKSTLCTVYKAFPPNASPSFDPPMRSTCPCSLSLSSIATAVESQIGPHDSGGSTDRGGIADWAARQWRQYLCVEPKKLHVSNSDFGFR